MTMTAEEILTALRALPEPERAKVIARINEADAFIDSARDGNDFDDEERAELFASLRQGIAEARAGDGVEAAEVLRELRAQP